MDPMELWPVLLHRREGKAIAIAALSPGRSGSAASTPRQHFPMDLASMVATTKGYFIIESYGYARAGVSFRNPTARRILTEIYSVLP